MNPSVGGKITQLQNRITRLSELIYFSTLIACESIKKTKEECLNNRPVSAFHALSEAEFSLKRLRINSKKEIKNLLAKCWEEKE